MKFEKYHGLGNDFVIVSYEEAINLGDFPTLAQNVCNRKTGIGADGLIILSTKDTLPEMIFYNADGSYDTMCGNGFRCLCLYLINNKIVDNNVFSVKTGAGILDVEVVSKAPFLVRVAMGSAEYTNTTITKVLQDELVVLGDTEISLSAAFVGTPHAVIFVDEIDSSFAEKYGPLVNELPYFPEGTSVNFCKVEDTSTISILTWERGVGLTLACGTGSCASATISKDLNKVSGSDIVVKHSLGDLTIETGELLYMKGSGTKVASGIYEN